MSEQGSLLGFLSDPRLAPYATGDIPVWLWSADATRILWGNPAAAAIFNARIVRRADRPHHRSQGLGRAADRAACRHAAAWRGAAARAAARFRRTHGRRADVRLLADLAGRPHAGHSGGRDRNGRAAAFAGRAGAASARRLRRAGRAVRRRRRAAARDAGGAGPARPRRQRSPRSAPRRSPPRRSPPAAPTATHAAGRISIERIGADASTVLLVDVSRRAAAAAAAAAAEPPSTPPAEAAHRQPKPAAAAIAAAAARRSPPRPQRQTAPPPPRSRAAGAAGCRPSGASRFASSGRWTTTAASRSAPTNSRR